MHARGTRRRGSARAVAGEGGTDSRRFLAVAFACAIALVVARPLVASAGWPLAGSARVALAFGAVYSAGEGGSAQHRGVDLAAASGARVVAPLAGRVSFAGSVPGVGGGRVTAVTVETAHGKVTLLPLGDVCVSRGSQIAEGDAIGVVAASGDGSSADTHLHVGVRRGELYVDPLGVIAPPPAPIPDAGASAGAGSAVPSGSGANVGAPVSVGTPAVTLAPTTSGAGANAPGAQARVVSGGQLAPGVSIAVRGSAAAGAPAGARAGSSGVSAGVRGPSAQPVATPSTPAVMGSPVTGGATGAAPKPANLGWTADLVARARAFAARSVRVASLALLGVMAALGALWPLWRRGSRKGPGKVLVGAVGEDVAAAPSR